MSKFSEVLQLRDTDKRLALLPSLDLKEKWSREDAFTLGRFEAKLFNLTAVWGCRMVLTEQEYTSLDIRAIRVQQAKQMLVEELFGEFRLPLIHAKQAVYNREEGRAIRILNELHDGMFHV